MTALLLILLTSTVVQLAAAVLAFRLNVIYGRHWAWTCIALALGFMFVRRALTLLNAGIGNDIAAPIPDEEALSLTSAISTLAASSVVLLGVAMIGPVLRV